MSSKRIRQFGLTAAAVALVSACAGEAPVVSKPAAPTGDNAVTVTFHPQSAAYASIDEVWLEVRDSGNAQVRFVQMSGTVAPPMDDDSAFTGQVALADGTYTFEVRAFDGTSTGTPGNYTEVGGTLVGVGLASNFVVNGNAGLDLFMVPTGSETDWGAGLLGPVVLFIGSSDSVPAPGDTVTITAGVLYERAGTLSDAWSQSGAGCGGTFGTATAYDDTDDDNVWTIGQSWSSMTLGACTLSLTAGASDTSVAHKLGTEVTVTGSLIDVEARFVDHPVISSVSIYADADDDGVADSGTALCTVTRADNNSTCAAALGWGTDFVVEYALVTNIQDEANAGLVVTTTWGSNLGSGAGDFACHTGAANPNASASSGGVVLNGAGPGGDLAMPTDNSILGCEMLLTVEVTGSGLTDSLGSALTAADAIKDTVTIGLIPHGEFVP